MALTILAEKICYYEDAIDSPDLLVELIESSDSDITEQDAIDKWHDWLASSEDEDYLFGQKKLTHSQKLDTSSGDIAFIYTTITEALTRAGKDYADRFSIEYVEPTPISISKYRIGADMGPHVDYRGESSIEPLMSAVMYLNDDYEGGELYFENQNILIKPKAGSIVIFPSVEPYFHEPKPVLKGQKYMVPAFWLRTV